jgi:hypothetical protein
MTNRPIRVELRRGAFERDGRQMTYNFSFPWGRKTVPAFIQPENMPAADRDADWTFAWFEVAKVKGVWTGSGAWPSGTATRNGHLPAPIRPIICEIGMAISVLGFGGRAIIATPFSDFVRLCY